MPQLGELLEKRERSFLHVQAQANPLKTVGEPVETMRLLHTQQEIASEKEKPSQIGHTARLICR
jgi:hypothetical protein